MEEEGDKAEYDLFLSFFCIDKVWRHFIKSRMGNKNGYIIDRGALESNAM